MPGFIKPQLAMLRPKPPSGDWLNEIKYDGYRVQVHIGPKRRAFTRTGLDWTKQFSTIVGAFDFPGQAIIDGEVVVVHEGRTSFSELQEERAAGRQDRLSYYAFDLLWLNGEDLRGHTQIERKRALERLFKIHKLEAPVGLEHGDRLRLGAAIPLIDFSCLTSDNGQTGQRCM